MGITLQRVSKKKVRRKLTMSRISRREFLMQVALGAGVLAMSKMPGSIGRSTSTLISTAEEKTIFLEGVVVYVEHDRLEVKNEETAFTLFVTPKTRLWKGTITSLEAVESGDYIFARGLPKGGIIEGEFEATKIWVNIANFYGMIVDREDNRISLCVNGCTSTAPLPVYVNADTLLNEKRGFNLSALTAGQYIQALGLYQKDGSLLATRIFTGS